MKASDCLYEMESIQLASAFTSPEQRNNVTRLAFVRELHNKIQKKTGKFQKNFIREPAFSFHTNPKAVPNKLEMSVGTVPRSCFDLLECSKTVSDASLAFPKNRKSVSLIWSHRSGRSAENKSRRQFSARISGWLLVCFARAKGWHLTLWNIQVPLKRNCAESLREAAFSRNTSAINIPQIVF